MPGGRLTSEERQRIAEGLAGGLGYTEMGRLLGRPASTVMREVVRNGGPEGYGAQRAHEDTRRRARRAQPRTPVPSPTPPAADERVGCDRDPDAVLDFTNSFSALLTQQGLPRMAAKVLACLYVTDEGALTAAELVQRLGVSPASVSHAVAFLEQQGMLRRERTAGGRRERYICDEDLWLRSTLVAARTNDALAEMSRRGACTLGAATPAGARFASSAEFLLLLNEAFRKVVEEYRRNLAGRNTGQSAGQKTVRDPAPGANQPHAF
ncbi:helix-turn-helix domain-containing protein [Streptomyces sp. NPDC050504]|uniref:GbsR/MarR family transcriptional regulator n=1 Tax=Streptomyces sp. NPDC050504 TaxID=3365618 RepID=UPI003792C7C7